MDNVTYEAYRSNPAVREQLEQEARDERRREVQRLIVAPVVRWVKQAFTRPQQIAARTFRSLSSFQI